MLFISIWVNHTFNGVEFRIANHMASPISLYHVEAEKNREMSKVNFLE